MMYCQTNLFNRRVIMCSLGWMALSWNVFYLTILYIALFSTRGFRKLTHCQKPRKKTQDGKWEKDEEELPDGMMERTEGEDYAIERDIVICMQRIWREEQRDQTD